MITNETALVVIDSPVRSIKARVECYENSTLVHSFNESDRLISVKVDRIGESSKFFGFSVAQKVNIKLIDTNRELSITTANTFKIYFNEVNCLPVFYVTEVHRDENTNELSITAYDYINKATSLLVGDLDVYSSSYTILEFAQSCARAIGVSGISVENVSDACFEIYYESGANFDGSETVRNAITAVAEATQTVYFINQENTLVFKRLDRDGEAVLTIDKSRYKTLSSKTNKRLGTINSCTELGDDVQASTTESGTVQYVRDNPFWDLREDRATLVDNALAAVGGLTINQFELDWYGNFLVEPGDKLGLITKDNETAHTYLLDDSIEYNGTYSQQTYWNYEESPSETSDNPTSLGDVIKKTRAEVDKVNQQITLVAEKTEDNSSEVAAIKVITEGITASVEKAVKDSEEALKRAQTVVTAEDVQIQIEETIGNIEGQDSITTKTGYVFDSTGLNISKTGSSVSTQITEDGMTVSRDGEEVLVADNEGVKATDLHTNYLHVGRWSRFQDYSDATWGDSTGCFWLGSA